jgi:O-antigen/teichoic acid export membrane protein
MSDGIERTMVRGGGLMLGSQLLRTIIRIGGLAILARMLSPDEFGLVAMVTIVLAFAWLFKDAGFSAAVIQHPSLSNEQLSTLFWIGIAIGAMTSTAVFAVAPLVAWFFGEPELTAICRLLSVSFLFSGASLIHLALLQRKMRFRRIACVNTLAPLTGLVVAILLACTGHGYWALVWQVVASAIGEMLLSWTLYPWIPSRPTRNSGVRKLVRFGMDVLGFNVINFFSRNLDKILIGKVAPPASLAFYEKAYQLLMFPLIQLRGPVQAVGTPGLSRVQGDPDQFQTIYLRMLSLLALIVSPLVVGMAVYAEPLVLFVLGEDWRPTIGIFQILAIAAWIQPLVSTRGMVLIACGKSRRYLQLGVIFAAFVTVGFIAGLPWGTHGVAWGYVAANILSFPVLQWWCFRGTPISLLRFCRSVQFPLFASAIMGACCWLTLPLLMHGLTAPLTLLIGGAGGFVVYTLVLWVIPESRRELKLAVTYLRTLRQPHGTSPEALAPGRPES